MLYLERILGFATCVLCILVPTDTGYYILGGGFAGSILHDLYMARKV